MADINKVIQALEQCLQTLECDGCPYIGVDTGCRSQAERDAVELLKHYKERVAGLEERVEDLKDLVDMYGDAIDM